MPELTHLRKDYEKGGLTESDLLDDPIKQFQHWFDEALAAKLIEPYAMTLATVTPVGQPTARIVLLRSVDQSGFQFFTNYLSRKGQDIKHHAQAALLFYWAELERQIRIEGNITRTNDATSDSYFAHRPRASQIAAVASAQSEVIADRAILGEASCRSNRSNWKANPCLDHNTGVAISSNPTPSNFWQGRPSRLHDRLRYRLDNHRWIIERLSP